MHKEKICWSETIFRFLGLATFFQFNPETGFRLNIHINSKKSQTLPQSDPSLVHSAILSFYSRCDVFIPSLCINISWSIKLFVLLSSRNYIIYFERRKIMLEKYGLPDLNVFRLKWMVFIQKNGKNRNIGGCFGSTS